MGSGCYGTGANNSCFNTPVSDKGVAYTGPAIPSLGICTGDKLNELEAIILQMLQDFAAGEGITLTDVDISECTFMDQFISCCSQDKSLTGLFTTVFKAICALKTDIDEVEQELIDATTYTFSLGCLTVANPTLQNVVNAIIANLCATNATLAALVTQVNSINTRLTNLETNLTSIINDAIASYFNSYGNTFVTNNIKSCGNTGMTKSAGVVTFTALVPPYCPIPYIGPLSNFDNSGAGIDAKGYCGWYICNGQNNTVDMRGYAFASATNVPGGGLDSRVSGYTTSIGDKNGTYENSLTGSNIPSLSGSLSVPTANIRKSGTTNSVTVFNIPGNTSVAPSDPLYAPTTSSIPFTTSGGSSAVDNRQPTYYGCWIMRFN